MFTLKLKFISPKLLIQDDVHFLVKLTIFYKHINHVISFLQNYLKKYPATYKMQTKYEANWMLMATFNLQNRWYSSHV